MAQQFNENIEIIDPGDNLRDISLEIPGRIRIWDSSQNARITIYENGHISLRDSNNNERTFIASGGDISLKDSNGTERAVISERGSICLRDSNRNERAVITDGGHIRLLDSNGNTRAFISYGGMIILRDSNGNERVSIGPSGKIWLRDSNGKQRAFIGTTGQYLNDSNGTLRAEMRSTSGQIFLRDSNGNARAFMGGDGRIRMWDSSQNERITIDGDTGDIRLRGADCAEDFDVSEVETREAGTVMVIDQEGKLKPCDEAYDKKVAGVVSGGGDSSPGIILDRSEMKENRVPIAINGKVYCKADARYSQVEVGDLLTTSPTSGHAMKADDPSKAFGAVIGKALCPLKKGKGLIPILVALQ